MEVDTPKYIRTIWWIIVNKEIIPKGRSSIYAVEDDHRSTSSIEVIEL